MIIIIVGVAVIKLSLLGKQIAKSCHDPLSCWDGKIRVKVNVGVRDSFRIIDYS